MKSSHKILAIAALAAAPLAAGAQELNENVSVEGVYKPEIIRQERLSAFPTRPDATLSMPTLSYDSDGRTIDFANTLTPMPATLWGATRPYSRHRGYFSGETGSYLNSNVSAGYRIIDTQSATLGAWLQYDSTSLFDAASYGDDTEQRGKLYRRRYNASAGVYGSRLFEGAGRLSASARYGFGWFNYYAPAMADATILRLPTQTTNDFNIALGWTATPVNSLEWEAAVQFNYLAFRDFVLPGVTSDGRRDGGYSAVSGQREGDLRLSAGVRMPWESGSRIGLDGALDLLFYSGGDSDLLPSGPVDNYGNLTLTPNYGFRRGLLNVRIGADVDLTFNAGVKDARYHLFHIAPDIRFDWRKDAVGFYLHVLGGSELQTLSMLRDRDYYTAPAIFTTRPVYSPVDATLGASFGPFAGFTAGLSVAYKISNHTPLGGWYGYWLGHELNPRGNQWGEGMDGALFSADNDLTIKGWSIGLDLDYKLAETVEAGVAATYQNQNGGKGYFNGYDRPRWTLDARLAWRPAKRLSIEACFNLRAVRNVYYNEAASGAGSVIIGGADPETFALRLPDFSSVGAKVRYDVTDRFGVWVKGDNLAGRRNVLLPGMESERIAVSGGCSVVF